METPQPLPVVLCLTALLDGLFEAVCARYGVFPIRGPLVRFLWKRFFRIKLLFGNLAARVAAGDDLSPRPSRPRASRRKRDVSAFQLTKWVCPKYGWLCRIASESIGASAFAWSLRHMLTTDPEMLALLAATPATARILRPLCWMLGVAEPKFPEALPRSSREPLAERECHDEAPRSGPIAATPPAPSAPAPRNPDPSEMFRPVAVLKAA